MSNNKIRKPWLAVLCKVERTPGGSSDCKEILYYTKTPILAFQPSEVERVVFMAAVKELGDIDAHGVEVFVTPFGFPTA